ncbi:Methyltransferase domain-containing protein [Desulfonispora thiosulfatigenes DSM 11270]|uniref:Methyltransferase domain-containing protein n=1 Tax=Desulfonispora thiosulfatigenes DSM 11270 TaxID=656914 RepID=A0A1W1UEL8_DESTI|nr:class I SAM-dependent methyltransferase [Desulfonispora thiosulfatigenes]SMB79473.1 Methyltransferase domain-containing protein [Desulfonispora thiosulfatigenes DSM 11270]
MKDFDKVSAHYDSFMRTFKLYKVREIKEVLNLQGTEIILDIGGGTGHLAQHLKEDCKKVYILDESEKMLSKIKPNKKIVPIVGDALTTNFKDKSIDVVILADVLHHISQQEKLIVEIERVLKDKGKILILDFDRKYLRTKLLRLFEYFLFGKLYFKTSREVKELLKDRFTVHLCRQEKYYFIIKGEKNAK